MSRLERALSLASIPLFVALFFLAFASGCAAGPDVREITDMMGRKVTVPDKIERLYAPSPYGAYMMYAIAPELMTGLVFAPKDGDKKFLPKVLWDLPVIGGGPRAANPETLAKSNPQLLIVWKNDANPVNDKQNEQLAKLGIPYVFVVADGMSGYPAAIRFLGKLTGREERAEAMAKLVEKTLADVQAAVNQVPAEKRPKVYYAEGTDGLASECNDFDPHPGDAAGRRRGCNALPDFESHGHGKGFAGASDNDGSGCDRGAGKALLRQGVRRAGLAAGEGRERA